MNRKIFTALAAALLGCGSTYAASVSYDFNSDPTSVLNFGGTLWDGVTTTHTGSANWRTNGGAGPVGGTTNGPVKGVNGDGFLQITFASASCGPTPTFSSSLSGCVLFDDFDQGLVTAGFTFDADLRIGNGDSNPADGFSINYVRNNDPVLVALLAGDTFPQMNGTVAPSPNGGQFSDNGSGTDDSLMEEGTQTGLSIGFDMWDSGNYTIPPTAPAVGTELPGLTHDGIGLDIRVDGVLQTTISMPNGTTATTEDEHGNPLTATDPNGNNAATDPTAIETGPFDGTACDTSLSWVHLKVVLDTSGVLNVYWKNHQILTNYQTAYFPSPGRLILASRVGGNTANIEIDNVQITTIPATVALVGAATGFIDGFQIQVGDSGNSTVDTNQPIALTLNGVSVTPTSVTKLGGTTTITYHTGGYPNILGSGSTNTVTLVAKDTGGNSITSGPRTFIAPTYGSIPGADAVTGVDTTKPGFKMLPWQSGAEPNRVYWANEQVIGLHGANNANVSGATDGGYADYTGLINFNINPLSAAGADAGQFRTTNGYPDMHFPGIPGANGLNGSSAEEILTFLQFQSPGVYQMGVDSDDGFAVTEGKNPRDRLAAQVLGEYDGGRGEGSPTTFTFVVTNAGVYPFRLIWFNGNGELPGNGAGLEWFTIESDGTKILLNDPSATNTSGVKALFSGPALPAFVSQVNPYPGQTGHLPGQVAVQLTDGSTMVNGSSILFQVDGSSTPAATVNKAGSVTTATLTFNPLLAPGAHTATLVWSDNGTPPATYSNTWDFTVMPYATVALDQSLSVPVSALDKTQPGFSVEVSQLDPSIVGDDGDSLPTQSDSMNALLAGLYFPWYGSNVADVLSSSVFNAPPYTNDLWFWTNAVDFNIVTSPGDFGLDYTLPGIPGQTSSTVNFAAAFDSWVVFPTAGFYVLGVNSDDGFRLSEGQGVTRQVLHVTGTGIDTDVAAVASTTNYGNTGFSTSIPLVPVSGPVMFVNSNNYTLGGTINLSGKIALMDNGIYGVDDSVLAYIAQTNGAIGFIEINNPTNGLPYVMGGGLAGKVILPSVNVNGDFGQRDWWLTNGTLTASIGADTHLILNSADYGKGMSHQDQVVSVPVAGAYPLHLLYFQGGGGAGLEWSVLNNGLPADGVRSLINDSTDSGSLLSYEPNAAQIISRPTVSVSNQNGTVKISYTGTLQSSPTVDGTYQNVQGATNPYTVPAGSPPAQFYRSH